MAGQKSTVRPREFTGRELEAGDVVAFTNGHSALPLLGRIESETPKSFWLHQLSESTERVNYRPYSVLVTSRRVVFISDQMRDLDDVEAWLHFKHIWERKN